MFNHKIEKFTKTVGGLPDQPNMEPQVLKNWFDAAPEELRRSLNGVCEDGAVLESKVNGIVERTFAGNVSESMLDDTLKQSMMMKHDIIVGEYMGDDVFPRKITLGFRPKAVYAQYHDGTYSSQTYFGHTLLIDSGKPETFYEIADDGFVLKQNASNYNRLNSKNDRYIYLAIR